MLTFIIYQPSRNSGLVPELYMIKPFEYFSRNQHKKICIMNIFEEKSFIGGLCNDGESFIIRFLKNKFKKKVLQNIVILNYISYSV